MTKTEEPRLSYLLDQAQALVNSKAATMSEIASVTGKSWKHVHSWIVAREYAPKGEPTLQLREWIDQKLSLLTPTQRKAFNACLRAITA